MSNLDDLIDRTHFDYKQNEVKAKQLEDRILKVPGMSKEFLPKRKYGQQFKGDQLGVTAQSMIVRGELYAPAEYDRPSYSQRQAGGYLRSADSKSDHLSFCSFQIINGKLNQHDSLKYLKKLGFTIPEYKSLNFTSQVEMYRKQWSDKKLFTNYSTDGIVVKINSRKFQLIREKSYESYPHHQMAIKY